jgi:large conductance mechanosensitive channel
MKIVQEFKEFAMRGNVVDMAVGIIIGAAFGKIISSFVADVLMPPIGMLIGGTDFTGLKIILKEGVMEGGKVIKAPATINYGNFIQVTIDFLIIAFAIFMMIKVMNSMKKKEVKPVEAAAPPPTPEEKLLTEIRDLLQKK